MKVLFLGLNYAPEEIGIAVYSRDLAEYLAMAGHAIEVVSAQPYYPAWQVLPGYRRGWRRTVENGVGVTRVPLYVPSQPNGTRRLLHHASFAASAMPAVAAAVARRRPDVVLAIAPSLMAAPAALVASRLTGAPAWLHVQDFEVGAAFGTGLLDGRSRTGRVALAAERSIIRRFDHVSSISPAMCAKLAALGIPSPQISEFRNWASNRLVAATPDPGRFRAEWDITTPYVALYAGNIANKQGIGIVIEVAERLRHRSDLTFVICGEGPNRAALAERASQLPNVRIHDLQPTELLSDLLAMATVHLLPQRGATADLVLPSKLTNMLASGRPVIATAAPGTGLAGEVAGCGVVTPPEDPAAFAEAVARILDDPERLAELGVAAKARARERWDHDRILAQFMGELEKLAMMHADEPQAMRS